MLSIQTNVNSMNAQENLRVTNQFQGRTIARLTSGFRINESGDDAAGLAVANKYRSDVAELMQGVRNANDGLSTLQIIDGGLNNISKMLDRLKTLATQSASATFTGSRATLNNEYTSLLSEIDRQAANIGLGSGSAAAGRHNKDLTVYLGGGASAANSNISVNLSSSTDLVNSNALAIASTSILGGSATVQGSSRTDLHTNTALFASNSSQQFKVHVEGQSALVTVTGTGSGITGAQAVEQINNQVAGLGISATINSTTGRLEWVSSKAFAVEAIVGVGAGPFLTTAADTTTVNTAMYRLAGTATSGFAGLALAETETFTINVGSQQRTVNLNASNAPNVDTAIAAINQQAAGIGVFAVKDSDSNGVILMSAVDFSITGTGGTAGDLGVFNAAPGAPTPATASADETAQAKAAITQINNAVSKLGVVQGKIGTSQNKLGYAIQLAQSQITSFSAAESRIRDADVASEAANLTKAQVLQQASLAALAQANSAPQAVLSLLRG